MPFMASWLGQLCQHQARGVVDKSNTLVDVARWGPTLQKLLETAGLEASVATGTVLKPSDQ
jgi:hypothetical protein